MHQLINTKAVSFGGKKEKGKRGLHGSVNCFQSLVKPLAVAVPVGTGLEGGEGGGGA